MKKPLKDIVLRGLDPTGHGYYGASRGNRKHQGVDYLAAAGANVYAPITGFVAKIGQVYTHTTEFKYIEVINDEYRWWLMYVTADEHIIKGYRVSEGEYIGGVQDIATYWNKNKKPDQDKMLNHLHVQVWKNGLPTDPEPIIELIEIYERNGTKES